jgi:hypothetical protein
MLMLTVTPCQEHTESSVDLRVNIEDQSKDYVFSLGQLSQAIGNATVKKKTDKFIITLKKVEEKTWYQLKKTT